MAKELKHGTTRAYGKGCRCEPCVTVHRAYRNKEYHEHPERWRAYELKKKYNITDDDYNYAFQLQKGLCAICGKPHSKGKRLDVDHNHETTMFRGLLCRSCNGKLGWYEIYQKRVGEYLAGK